MGDGAIDLNAQLGLALRAVKEVALAFSGQLRQMSRSLRRAHAEIVAVLRPKAERAAREWYKDR